MSRKGPGAGVRVQILAVWAGRCAYCGAEADHLDHVIPRAQGGAHRGENRLPACSPCGQAKADRSLAEWLADVAATGSLTARPRTDAPAVAGISAHDEYERARIAS